MMDGYIEIECIVFYFVDIIIVKLYVLGKFEKKIILEVLKDVLSDIGWEVFE